MRMRDKTESLKVVDDLEKTRQKASSTSRGFSTSSRVTKYTNMNLPYGLGSNKSWRNEFCNTFFEYIGTAADPFSIEESYIQDVWSVVYSDLPFPDDKKDVAAIVSIVSSPAYTQTGDY